MDDAKLLDRVNELLSYGTEAGLFTWKVSRSRLAKIGSVAGTHRPDGYISIGIDGRYYLAHRLAFLLTHGYFPKEVDHINGVKTDNRACNLREATRQQNMYNRGKYLSNSSGFKGVYFDRKCGRYNAQASLNGRTVFIGSSETPELASELYNTFAAQHHSEFLHPSCSNPRQDDGQCCLH